MSIKLYNGLRLADQGASLFDVVEKVSDAVRQAYAQAAQKIVAEEVVSVVDSAQRRAEHAGEALFVAAQTDWSRRQLTHGRYSTFNDPLRFSISFGMAASGNVLAYPFYGGDGRALYEKALERTALFDDYHFQDQTDRPDDVDDESWAQRAADWLSLVNADGDFSSLPMWQLQNSIDEVFSFIDRSEIDANKFVSPAARLSDALVNDVCSALMIQCSIERIGEVVPAARRAVRTFLASNSASALEEPAPIPDLMTEVGALAPFTSIPEDIVAEIAKQATQILAHG